MSRHGYEIFDNTDASTVTCDHGKNEMICRCWVTDLKSLDLVEKQLVSTKKQIRSQEMDIERLAHQAVEMNNEKYQLQQELKTANEALDKCVLVEPAQEKPANSTDTIIALVEHFHKREEILAENFSKRIAELEKKCQQLP